ncbi:hypothetical protein WR25_19701 [Diploscapter pachys]|uniref:Nuclear receptor domain-containing protein n=1 Tax=Diploscapter pachys TaxID=2018661 RepID=A0A2A2JVP2_9BILA|nr:hypothetical protein WR25_19701 [Diploscapter pachys]
MSAGAQPCSNQRASANAADANDRPPTYLQQSKEKTSVGTLCVVCGDRACSHLYYGVAACHGCKCFFWRTVKSGLTYSCRFGGDCSISTAGRNACRFCRFNRCIKAGMKIEAVRMESKKADKKKRRSDIDTDDESSHESIDSPVAKRQKSDDHLLISTLSLIDKTAADGNGKKALTMELQPSLEDLIEEPALLNGHRTEMTYKSFTVADETLCSNGERRLLTWTLDWCRQLTSIEDDLKTSDKLALFRAGCTPLTLFELAIHTTSVRGKFGPENLIALPNDSYLQQDVSPPSNCFLNPKTVNALVQLANRNLKSLELQPKEILLMKALIILNPDASGLSTTSDSTVSAFRDRVVAALFNICSERQMDAASAAARLSKMHFLISQITLMASDLVEHLRLRNTFVSDVAELDPILIQLYGDIFEDTRSMVHMAEDAYLAPSQRADSRSQGSQQQGLQHNNGYNHWPTNELTVSCDATFYPETYSNYSPVSSSSYVSVPGSTSPEFFPRPHFYAFAPAQTHLPFYDLPQSCFM